MQIPRVVTLMTVTVSVAACAGLSSYEESPKTSAGVVAPFLVELHFREAWQQDGRDVALLVGGPDGLDPALKASADETLRLSDLTLPHAFVRVLLAEALYRAWTVLVNHPYHRE